MINPEDFSPSFQSTFDRPSVIYNRKLGYGYFGEYKGKPVIVYHWLGNPNDNMEEIKEFYERQCSNRFRHVAYPYGYLIQGQNGYFVCESFPYPNLRKLLKTPKHIIRNKPWIWSWKLKLEILLILTETVTTLHHNKPPISFPFLSAGKVHFRSNREACLGPLCIGSLEIQKEEEKISEELMKNIMELGALGFELTIAQPYLFHEHELCMNLFKKTVAETNTKIPWGLGNWIEKCLTRQIPTIDKAWALLKEILSCWLSVQTKKRISTETKMEIKRIPSHEEEKVLAEQKSVHENCLTLTGQELNHPSFLKRFFFSTIFPSHASISCKLHCFMESLLFLEHHPALPSEFVNKMNIMHMIVFRAIHYAFSSVDAPQSEELESSRLQYVRLLKLPLMTEFFQHYFQIRDVEWMEKREKTMYDIGLIESLEENKAEKILHPQHTIQLMVNESWSISIYETAHHDKQKWISSYPYRTYIYRLVFAD